MEAPRSKYYFKNDQFIIEDYDKQKTFASFLPGLAGKMGIPLWCHYINRAQVISSFGIRDKDGSILEFYPANTAYRIIDKMGFRTFIKVNNKVYEPFSPLNTISKRTMAITPSDVTIEEINEELKLTIQITYFGLPEENIAGLVRKVKIINNGPENTIELLDGITQLLPAGTNEWMLKHQSNLLKSWMDVKILQHNIGYYIVNSIPADEAEVSETTVGNYYLSIYQKKIIKPIYDANIIFGYDTTLLRPLNFERSSIRDLISKKNISANKVPIGFTPLEVHLAKNETMEFTTIIGQVASEELIIEKVNTFTSLNYFDKALIKARSIITSITDDVETYTSDPLFDNYMRQNYLDNILRGGYPIFIDTTTKHFVYHLYSRRHGDTEREYNFFSLAPEYLSQGNGNFRDVCQNRRSDCLFHPEVGIYNVKTFAELIQLDGYNPLGVHGSLFIIKDQMKIRSLCQEIYPNDNTDTMFNLLSKPFTPGLIVNKMEQKKITSEYPIDQIFEKIFEEAVQESQAEFGEGYWSDHWTYILDLLESTLAIYPEKKNEYLFNDQSYRFFESPVYVLPRDQKYCLTKDHLIRQYGSLLINDKEKIKALNLQPGTNWAKHKNGDYVTTSLYGKLFILALNKFALLDSDGIGIEMEANKPGWNDAMNGLPGLFGSGISETIELYRLVNFLLACKTTTDINLPIEFVEFMKDIVFAYHMCQDEMNIWDNVANAREKYRAKIRFGCQYGMINVPLNDLTTNLQLFASVLNVAINKAKILGNGLLPTFLIRKVEEATETGKIGNYQLPTMKVTKFSTTTLPLFLEANARYLKISTDLKEAKNIYKEVKKTELYDHKLKMYKTSVSLDDYSYEIGRIRAFQKGWLERESNFLHMTYKYLLGILKSGLYNEFYNEFFDNAICFRSPVEYGRSTLENSSFIATSNNPDPNIWGQGFVARLSGSTAEMLSIWQIMMFGKQPFKFDNGNLTLEFKPVLHQRLFDDNGIIKAKFLSNTIVEYRNPRLFNTYDSNLKISKIIIDNVVMPNNIIDSDYALQVRNGKVKKIIIEFN